MVVVVRLNQHAHVFNTMIDAYVLRLRNIQRSYYLYRHTCALGIVRCSMVLVKLPTATNID